MGEKGVRNCLPECTICHFTMEPRIAANFTMGKTQKSASLLHFRTFTAAEHLRHKITMGQRVCLFVRRSALLRVCPAEPTFFRSDAQLL